MSWTVFRDLIGEFARREFSGIKYEYTWTHANQPHIDVFDEAAGRKLFQARYHEQDGWSYGLKFLNDARTGGATTEQALEWTKQQMLKALADYKKAPSDEAVEACRRAYLRLSTEERTSFRAWLQDLA